MEINGMFANQTPSRLRDGDQLMMMRDVMASTGIRTPGTVMRCVHDGHLPPPIQLGPRTRVWIAREVEARVEAVGRGLERIRRSGARRAHGRPKAMTAAVA